MQLIALLLLSVWATHACAFPVQATFAIAQPDDSPIHVVGNLGLTDMVVIPLSLALFFLVLAGLYLRALFLDTASQSSAPLSVAPSLPSYTLWNIAFHRVRAHFLIAGSSRVDVANILHADRRAPRAVIKTKLNAPTAGPGRCRGA